MSKRVAIAVVWILAVLTAEAQAQPVWPSKLIRIVVPFAAGSFTDIAARSIAAELAAQLGQQVVVENRVGAGGTLGTEVVAKAPGDGYTLLLSDNSFVMAPGLYQKLAYDPAKDFIQISQVAESPSLLVARLGLPARNLKGLVDLARAKPGELTFGSGGVGSSAHLATELLMSVAKIRMTHVPFKGVVLAVAEVVGERIDMSIASLASGMTMVSAGKVQGFGVTGRERSTLLPAVPTFAEAGFPGYDMSYWWGIAAPAGTAP
ncbi:MAG TPA: tripartite tricarboxylate transporter substrate-binding protein, partial [Burkholderiales bacterium]|nr:tripartite tricarboxylate transporter substrate-binding protein [Burkholderiales bacterium]